MASPRLAISALTQRSLSPHAAQNLLSIRQSLSPRTPDKLLNSGTKCDQRTSNKRKALPFSIDTPNRKKIVNDGLPDEERSLLGFGGFGTVYKASYKGSQVAVKMIKRRNSCDAAFEAEKHASTLRDSGIVQVLGIEQGAVWSLIIMELCSISLQDKLNETSLTKKERIDTWSAIACALQFCHNGGIVHADIKPKNILIASDGQLKLADFGSSIVIGEQKESSLRLHGTPGYVAPEVIKGFRPSISSDIYSLGILAWQLLAREAPFAGYHPHTILYLTGRGSRPAHRDIDDECRGKYTTLYQELWSEDAVGRPPLTVIIDKLQELYKT